MRIRRFFRLYLMHDAVPKLVAIAVRMVITICITVFHVSFFIIFNL